MCGDMVREVSFADSSLQYCPTCQTRASSPASATPTPTSCQRRVMSPSGSAQPFTTTSSRSPTTRSGPCSATRSSRRQPRPRSPRAKKSHLAVHGRSARSALSAATRCERSSSAPSVAGTRPPAATGGKLLSPTAGRRDWPGEQRHGSFRASARANTPGFPGRDRSLSPTWRNRAVRGVRRRPAAGVSMSGCGRGTSTGTSTVARAAGRPPHVEQPGRSAYPPQQVDQADQRPFQASVTRWNIGIAPKSLIGDPVEFTD